MKKLGKGFLVLGIIVGVRGTCAAIANSMYQVNLEKLIDKGCKIWKYYRSNEDKLTEDQSDELYEAFENVNNRLNNIEREYVNRDKYLLTLSAKKIMELNEALKMEMCNLNMIKRHMDFMINKNINNKKD